MKLSGIQKMWRVVDATIPMIIGEYTSAKLLWHINFVPKG